MGNIFALVLIGFLFVLALVLLSGKALVLIAGYNMMSEEAKGRYDERRLGAVVGLYVLAVDAVLIVAYLASEAGASWPALISLISILALTALLIYFTNTSTWIKRKA